MENKKGLTFLQTTIPAWRVVVMNKALQIRFENLEFYIGSKYGRLAVSKDGNYFFSISIVKEWRYDTTFNGKKATVKGDFLFDTVVKFKALAAQQFEKTTEQKENFKELADMLDKLEAVEKAKEELLTTAPTLLKGEK